MPSGLKAFAEGSVDWTSDTIVVAAVDSSYTQSDADTHADDLTGVLATVTLTGCTVSAAGVLDADDGMFTGVGAGDTIVGLMAYKDTGTPSTSPLLIWQDTNEDSTPISRTSDGSAIPLVWSATADAIASL